MKIIGFLLTYLFITNVGMGQEVIPLWPDEIPNFRESDTTETHEANDIL